MSAVFAIAIPLFLWPLGVARILKRFDINFAGTLGFVSGPLWMGWLLGLLVILFPGGNPLVLTAIVTSVPIALFAFGKPVASKTNWGEISLSEWLAILGIAACTLLIAFNAVAYPTTEHDRLVVDLFADRLRLSWDFWSLPRYAPDSQGFYYPLAHPPALISLLAWIKLIAPLNWIGRLVSGYMVVGIFLALYRCANSLSRGAGAWSILLLYSSPIFLLFLGNNSQDTFRYAAFAGALLTVVNLISGRRRDIVLSGALFGLGAAYHSLQILFVGIVPFALVFANRFSKDALRRGAVFIVSALGIGLYPYLSNFIYLKSKLGLNSFLIPTRSLYKLPTANLLLHELMVSYTGIETTWKTWINGRLGPVSNVGDAGYVGLAFLVFVLLAFVLKKEDEAEKSKKATIVLGLSALFFVLLTMDAGDYIYELTGQRFWVNRRYPQTILPVMALVAGILFNRLLRTWIPSKRRLRESFLIVVLATVFVACIWPTRSEFSFNSRFYREPGADCIFCSDETKLRSARGTGMYRAIHWLEGEGRRCLTFREGEYFSWSAARGATYYSPLAESAMSAPTSEAASQVLLSNGIDCVLADQVVSGTKSARDMPFAKLPGLKNVWPLEVYEANVWLLQNAPVRLGTLVDASLPVTGQSFTLPFPKAQYSVLSMEREGAEPLTVVGYGVNKAGQERIFLRNATTDREIRVPVVQLNEYVDLKFEFSQAITLKRLTLQSVSLESN